MNRSDNHPNAPATLREIKHTPSQPPLGTSGIGRLVLNIAVLVGTVALFVALAEAGLRIRFAHSLDFSMEMWKYAVALKHPVANPRLSFAHIPNRSAVLMGVSISTNSHGLRDREYPEAKPQDVYRIVMLGDSTTLGWGVPEEQTVAKVLERELNRAAAVPGRRFEVLNAGVGNYGTVQELAHYQTYDRVFHPDMVILQYFINDPEPVPVERYGSFLRQSYAVALTLARFDAMLRLTGARPNWKEYYSGLYADDRPGFQAAKTALAELAAATRADGARLLVTLLPELHEINGPYPFSKEHEKIEAVLDANRIPGLELIDGLRGHGPESALWVTSTDSHPNGTASNLIVAQMLPWVLAHLSSVNPE
jgi:hypothetical protein